VTDIPIYYVTFAKCTDIEPRPGWYISAHDDAESFCPFGPYLTKREAQEARDEYQERNAP
jgi:hypothetical protein